MKTKIVSELANEKRSKFFPLKHKDYVIESVTADEFYKEMNKIYSKVFPSSISYKPDAAENKKLAACFAEHKKIHHEKFLFKHKGKVVGWSMGEMQDFESFYMRNSGIIPAHQNKGIYKAFLSNLEKYIFGLGYARITSQHAPTNAKMISLKLKQGFVVTGQETHERWGFLLKIVKFSSKKRADYYFKKVD